VSEERKMTSGVIDLTNKKFSNPAFEREKSAKRRWTAWHVGAFIGFFFGFWVFTGTCFHILLAYSAGEKPYKSWLLLVALALIVFGAICFDKSDDPAKFDEGAE
jgi:uncharacterized iron-regulated membrane protein